MATKQTGPNGGPAGAVTRYTGVAILLHWAIAGFILFNLALGYFMEGFPQPFRLIVLGLHGSSGFTVLALTGVRIVWRLRHRPPALLPAARWEHATAHGVHGLLYLLMVAMPLTGWAILSAHPPASATWSNAPRHPPRAWGLPLPPLGPIEAIGATPEGGVRQARLHERLVRLHGLGGFIMIGLLLLHVGGALKHQLADRQAELERMGLGRRRVGADVEYR